MKNRVLILVLFLLFGSLQVFALEQELLSNGFRYYELKDYSGAADYLGQVVDMNPNNDQARFYLVYSLYFSGSFEVALQHASVLQRKFPREQSYKVLYAQIDKEIKKKAKEKEEAARRSYIPKEVIIGGYESKDIIREPRVSTSTPRIVAKPRAKTPVEKAIELIDKEEYDEARAKLKDILKKDSNNYMALHQLGVINFTFGDYKAAIKDFKKALKISPKHFQSQFLLANCYKGLGDYKQGEKEFEKALKIQPDMFAKQNLAEISIKLGKIDRAAKLYNEIIETTPDFADAKAGLANVRHLQGQNIEALELINSLLRSGKTSSEISFIRGVLLGENQLYSEATAEMARLVAEYPTNQTYKVYYAKCLLNSYDLENALRILTEIIQDQPNNPEARLVLGEVYLASGSTSDAQRLVDEVEQEYQLAAAASLNAKIATQRKEDDAARRHYQDYVNRAPGQPKPLYIYGQYLESVKAWDDAITVYNELIKKYAESDYLPLSQGGIARAQAQMGGTKTQKTPAFNPNLRPGSMKY